MGKYHEKGIIKGFTQACDHLLHPLTNFEKQKYYQN